MIDILKVLKILIVGTFRKTILFKPIIKSNYIGRKFYCGKYCSVSSKNQFHIGDNFYMGRNCHLGSNLKIGNNVMFASYVACIGGDHVIDDINIPIRFSGRDELKTTIIEDDVWIGHGVIILHGVNIANGAVVAAGAVVTKSIPANAIYGGNPATLIRYRKFNNN